MFTLEKKKTENPSFHLYNADILYFRVKDFFTCRFIPFIICQMHLCYAEVELYNSEVELYDAGDGLYKPGEPVCDP